VADDRQCAELDRVKLERLIPTTRERSLIAFRHELAVSYCKLGTEPMNDIPASTERRRQRLLAQIAKIGYALPGSLTVRHTRCSSAGCRCRAEQPALHGPYYSWTRKIDGKTVTRLLSAQQAERYTPWFQDARKLRALIAQLEALSLQAAEQAEGWGEK